jgi:hypothetical protein
MVSGFMADSCTTLLSAGKRKVNRGKSEANRRLRLPRNSRAPRSMSELASRFPKLAPLNA